MANQSLNLTPTLYTYLLNQSLREAPVLKHLRDETLKLPGFNMQIAPEQGQFMALLIEMLQAKKTLDIGTFTGYSALVVALAMPAKGVVHSFDINLETSNIAQKFWQEGGVANKIKLHLQPASTGLQQLIDAGEANTFDFAFIDADKNNYDDYYEKALKLLRPGGLVIIDNVLWGGSVSDENVNDKQTNAIRDLNKKLLHDQRISLSMLPVADGLTLARKH